MIDPPSSSEAAAEHTTVVEVETSVLGETDMVVISGPVLMMTMVMVELDDPPDVSVAVTVQVSVSSGDTMVGVSVKLAALPRTSPDAFVQA